MGDLNRTRPRQRQEELNGYGIKVARACRPRSLALPHGLPSRRLCNFSTLISVPSSLSWLASLVPASPAVLHNTLDDGLGNIHFCQLSGVSNRNTLTALPLEPQRLRFYRGLDQSLTTPEHNHSQVFPSLPRNIHSLLQIPLLKCHTRATISRNRGSCCAWTGRATVLRPACPALIHCSVACCAKRRTTLIAGVKGCVTSAVMLTQGEEANNHI
jgi:hypothetical protein